MWARVEETNSEAKSNIKSLITKKLKIRPNIQHTADMEK
jgi:hypothetical protein